MEEILDLLAHVKDNMEKFFQKNLDFEFLEEESN